MVKETGQFSFFHWKSSAKKRCQLPSTSSPLFYYPPYFLDCINQCEVGGEVLPADPKVRKGSFWHFGSYNETWTWKIDKLLWYTKSFRKAQLNEFPSQERKDVNIREAARLFHEKEQDVKRKEQGSVWRGIIWNICSAIASNNSRGLLGEAWQGEGEVEGEEGRITRSQPNTSQLLRLISKDRWGRHSELRRGLRRGRFKLSVCTRLV